MLVLGVIVDLLIDITLNLDNLLLLASHLLGVFGNANAFVVESLFLLVDSQLLSLFVRVHLGLLSRANLI